ncbi:odorant receptor 49b-like [Osmia bicornis bicornis]|uniref:odorant receptor 49b-like n=1 Tax=Osmia bicornis bicornis TaxID=1437191 RepID=UPI0010FA250B|nr:odorant receptor 49b-like [Osmia bicornis bicornis]
MIRNLREILNVLELAGTISCTWPLDPNTKRWKKVAYNIRWTFAFVDIVVVSILLLIKMYYIRHDIVELTKAISLLSAITDGTLNLFFCKLNASKLQVLIAKVRKYLDTANENENKQIQFYVDQYKVVLSVVGMSYIINGSSFNLLPFYTDQVLPIECWYPFSIETPALYCVAYVLEACCVVPTALAIFIDYKVMSLLFYIAARLNVLGEKLKQVDNYEQLANCIEEHQELLGFLEDTRVAVKALLFKVVVTMGATVISAGFPLLYMDDPMSDLQTVYSLGSFVIVGAGHVYLLSRPAEDLKESGIQFETSITDIQWIGQSKGFGSSVVIMLQRSQKPCIIPLGLIPALSMEYFTSFLTTIYSYFMAMRTMIEA